MAYSPKLLGFALPLAWFGGDGLMPAVNITLTLTNLNLADLNRRHRSDQLATRMLTDTAQTETIFTVLSAERRSGISAEIRSVRENSAHLLHQDSNKL